MGTSAFDNADRRVSSEWQPGDGALHLFRLSLYMQRIDRLAREILREQGLPALLAWGVALRVMVDCHDAQRPAQTESDDVYDYEGAELEHPTIRTARMTCRGCPEQWDGELHDGRFFYFRYRFGWASLAVGPTLSTVQGHDGRGVLPSGVDALRVQYGGSYSGQFDTPEERTELFDRLLEHIDGAGE